MCVWEKSHVELPVRILPISFLYLFVAYLGVKNKVLILFRPITWKDTIAYVSYIPLSESVTIYFTTQFMESFFNSFHRQKKAKTKTKNKQNNNKNKPISFKLGQTEFLNSWNTRPTTTLKVTYIPRQKKSAYYHKTMK